MYSINLSTQSLNPLLPRYREITLLEEDGDFGDIQVTADDALIIANDCDVTTLPEAVLRAGAIILEFPKFADGRAYSQARNLRERLGFNGHIIARGDILRDQVLFMARCGIDVIDVADADRAGFEAALAEFSQVYQTSADRARPVWSLRAHGKQTEVAAA